LVAFAFCLKLLLLPWQAGMLAFYKGLTPVALLAYLAFYYPYFLTVVLLALGLHFGALLPHAHLLVAGLCVVSAISAASTVMHTHDLRGVLVVSSLLNLTFLVVGLAAIIAL